MDSGDEVIPEKKESLFEGMRNNDLGVRIYGSKENILDLESVVIALKRQPLPSKRRHQMSDHSQS